MSQYLKISKLVVLSAALLMVGCASHKVIEYNRPSPSIGIMKESGNTRIDRRDETLRYDPKANLAANVREAGEVMITVTFRFKLPRNTDRPPTTNHCRLHIKPMDSSLSDVYRCKAEPAQGTFLIYFEMAGEKKMFDLFSLGGECVGGCPYHYWSNQWGQLIVGRFGKEENVRYIYVGDDPLK